MPSDDIKQAFLKCCISNNMDGTEDIIWEEEAANDGDSNVDGTEDIVWEEEAANDGDSNVDGDYPVYPESDKELHAVFDSETIDEVFLGFR